MGAIAESIAAFAQPLLEQTDGSEEQMQRAFIMSQVCFNLAMVQEDRREKMLSELRVSLKMDDEEFDAFRRIVVIPMIRRHEEMFPLMHRRVAPDLSQSGRSLPAATERSGARENGPCNRPLRTVSL